MRAFRSAPIGVLLGALVACCSAALPGDAQVMATVGHQAWRFAYVSGLADANVASVTAPGRRDAWAVGTYQNAKHQARPLVLHWNGRRWARFAVPGMPAAMVPTLVTSTSPDDVWIFVRSNSDPSGEEFRWNGQSWSELPGPPSSNGGLIGSAVVLSDGSAWELGNIACTGAAPPACTALWQWDGVRWNLVQVPTDVQELAGSRNHVWLVGQDSARTYARPVVFRWTGAQWAKFPGPYGRRTLFPTIAATPSGGLWLLSLASTRRASTLLYRWRAGAWSRIVVPSAFGNSNGLVADGFAGVWVGSTGHWTGRQWINTSRIAPTPRGAWALSAPVAVVQGMRSAWTPAFHCTRGSCRIVHWNALALNGRRP